MKTLIPMLVCLLLASPVLAQQSLSVQQQRETNIARKLIDDKRNSALAYNMNFTKAEKEKFWPLYREYREAMAKVGDKRSALIFDYGANVDSMTERKARQLLDDSFAVEKETIKTKEKYVRRFRKILPETKVVRLMQIEKRMDTMVEMKIAEGIPLME